MKKFALCLTALAFVLSANAQNDSLYVVKHDSACVKKADCSKDCCKENADGKKDCCKEKAASGASATVMSGNVPYTIARNYFVRNDSKFQGSKLIKNAEDFEAIFGKAATMGENGTPTPIDFDKQFVLAIVRPETKVNTQITPNTLNADANELKFNYNILQGREQSHTIVPALILIIDRQYLRQNINVSSRVKHLTIEDDPDAVLQGVYD